MRVHLLLTCALLPLACTRAAAPPPPDAKAEPAAPSTTIAAAPAVPATAADPLAAAAPISGRVVETMDSGGYTYLRLETANGGQTWAAVRETKVAKGAQVTIVDAMAMDGFESPRLKRKFDHIVFGRLKDDAGPAPAAGPAGLPPGHPAPQRATAAAVTPVPVEKATGANARTVAEVHAQRKVLHGRPVVVRGQVVKFLPGIMGRNWAHLRDGSGSASAKDDDLTVTTSDTLEVGSVVTVSGTVAADKDFGAGYAYAVIVEGATLAR